MPPWLNRLSIVALCLSLASAIGCVVAIVYASRADLLDADAVWVCGYQIIPWHEGADFRLTLCNYTPPQVKTTRDPVTGKELIPFSDILSGPYWRMMDAVVAINLWKALAVSLIVPLALLSVRLCSRFGKKSRGFAVIPTSERAA